MSSFDFPSRSAGSPYTGPLIVGTVSGGPPGAGILAAQTGIHVGSSYTTPPVGGIRTEGGIIVEADGVAVNDGDAATPGFRFSGSVGMGLYRIAGVGMGFAVSSAEIARWVPGAADFAVQVRPLTDNTTPLGTTGRRWADLQAVTATFGGLVVANNGVAVPAGQGLTWSGGATRIITPEDNVQGALIQAGGGCQIRVGGTTLALEINGSTLAAAFSGLLSGLGINTSASGEVARVGLSSSLARLRLRGFYAASPSDPPTNEADLIVVDTGAAQVLRCRYNDGGTIRVGDLALV